MMKKSKLKGKKKCLECGKFNCVCEKVIEEAIETIEVKQPEVIDEVIESVDNEFEGAEEIKYEFDKPILEVEEPIKQVEEKPELEENFIPKKDITKFLESGWQITNITDNTGFSIADNTAKNLYLKALSDGRLVYVTRDNRGK